MYVSVAAHHPGEKILLMVLLVSVLQCIIIVRNIMQIFFLICLERKTCPVFVETLSSPHANGREVLGSYEAGQHNICKARIHDVFPCLDQGASLSLVFVDQLRYHIAA